MGVILALCWEFTAQTSFERSIDFFCSSVTCVETTFTNSFLFMRRPLSPCWSYRELKEMFPASSRGYLEMEEPQTSALNLFPSNHHRGQGTPVDPSGLRHAGDPDNDNCCRSDDRAVNKQLHIGSAHHHMLEAMRAGSEKESRAHTSSDEDESNFDKRRAGTRTLVDDHDLSNEIDGFAATATDAASGGATPLEGGMPSEQIGPGSGAISIERGDVHGSDHSGAEPRTTKTLVCAADDSVLGGGKGGVGEGYDPEHERMVRPCKAGGDILEASSGGFGGDNEGGASTVGRSIYSIGHGGDDDTGSELTLGRPDPSSVHWKFSRRLLQT